MNNYSWLQQKLHQIALSSQFMREVTFDVESSAILKKQSTDNHIFVAGLARSGTTILLNALYKQTNLHHSLIKICLSSSHPIYGQNYLLVKKI